MKSIFTFLLSIMLFTASAQTPQLSGDTLSWSDLKPLTWKDFKGKPSNDLESGECLMVLLADFSKPNPLKPAQARAVAVFDRQHSHTDKAKQTAEELRYYQVMFNIYELHARKLRQEFKNTKFGLDPNKTFQEKYAKAINTLNERVREYRNDTDEGEELAEVQKWEKLILAELQALKDFAQ